MTNHINPRQNNFLLKAAFTLAEVLIVVGIIGVIAEMTIPTLIQEYQKQVYVARLEKFYSVFQNGTKAYMASQGCSDLSCTGVFDMVADYDPNWATRVADFVNSNFKVMKTYLRNSSDSDYTDYTTRDLAGSIADWTKTNHFLYDYTFLTADGMLIGINDDQDWGNCQYNFDNTPATAYCGTVEVDVNAFKGPNITGRDTFIFTLMNDGSLLPLYSQKYANMTRSQWPGVPEMQDWSFDQNYWAKSSWWCGNPGKTTIDPYNDEIQGLGCAARVIEEGWKMNY